MSRELLDIVFTVLGGLTLLGWKKPVLRLAGFAVLAGLLIRQPRSELAVILLAVPASLAFLWLAGRGSAFHPEVEG
jgi:hypothetical protein